MPRISPVHYIAPSTISITPNANESAYDLAIYLAQGAKIKVYSYSISELDYQDGISQVWTLTGRNRRLATDSPYTIYARLQKDDKSIGYLVFAPKIQVGDVWKDKYPYVTMLDGLAKDTANYSTGNYWYIKLGEVSAPVDDARTLTFDTGILGTDQFNNQWNLDPDDMPLRVALTSTIDAEDAGSTPYVPWGKFLILHARLLEGWVTDASAKVDHWTISRNTGDVATDDLWPDSQRAASFAASGDIELYHIRNGVDDFAGKVSAIFTVTAWGVQESDSSDSDSSDSGGGEIVPLAMTTVTILAETAEKYEIVLSNSVVSFNPLTGEYSPSNGINVSIRATDQKTEVYKITKDLFTAARLSVEYSLMDSGSWVQMSFVEGEANVAIGTIPITLFQIQKSVNLRLKDAGGKELDTKSIAFVRGGEDTKEREWIFLRSQTPISFGDAQSAHPLPYLIEMGEVNPDGAAREISPDKNQAGWVPAGWFDDMQGTDEQYRYEYGSYRDFVTDSSEAGGHWGDFTAPSLWDYHADDALSYYCRWTLDGEEIWQLPQNKDGKFAGKLPLVATLTKRTSSGEEPVIASSTVITVRCEGLDNVFTINTQNPQLVVSEESTPELAACLDSMSLTGLAVTFAPDDDLFTFFIPVATDKGTMAGAVEEYGSEYFLSKTHDDTASGNISFGKNIYVAGDEEIDGELKANGQLTANHIQSTEYTGDGMLDAGYKLWYENGRAKLVIDDLVARGTFSVNELESRIWTYAGGNMIFSGAGSTIFFVEYLNADGEAMGYTYINSPWLLRGRALLASTIAWAKRKQIQRQLTPEEQAQVVKFRCYEFSDNGTMQTRNWWRANDLAFCQSLNHVKNKMNSDGSYSGQASNTVFWRRVAGIGSKEIEILNDGRVYDYVDLWNLQNVTGQTYKDTDGSIKIITDSVPGYDNTYNDWPAAGDVIVQRGNAVDVTRQCCVTIEVEGDQLHGFKIYDTINTYSAANTQWVSLGYDLTTGKADMKVYGDAYIGARDESAYLRFTRGNGNAGTLEIKAIINLSSPLGNSGQTFSQFMSTLSNSLSDINNQLDKKAETWYQPDNPESTWYNPQATPPLDERSEHVGDMWYCTIDISGTSYKAGTTWYYQKGGTTQNPTYTWVQQNIPQSVFDTLDRKAAVYVTWNAWGANLQVRDLYIPSVDHTEGSGSSAKTYKKDKVYRCTNASTQTFEEINYTDDSSLNDFMANQYVIQLTNGTISSDVQDAKDSASSASSSASSAATSAASALTRAQNAESSASSAASSASSASSSASSAATSASNAAGSASSAASSASSAASDAASAKAKADALDYVKNALNSDTEVVGGLMLTSLIALRQKSGNSYITTGGLQGYKGDGTAIGFWMGGAMSEQDAKIVFRHNGSGFMAGNKFNWDKDGNAKIGGFVIGTDYIGQNSDISQQDTGYTYITRNGYINVKKASNGEALRVNGTANIYGTLFTQSASQQNINGSDVNINVGNVNGTNTNIGNTSCAVNIKASKTSITGAVEMSSTLSVSGAVSFSGAVKTGTFTLPTSPSIGTVYFCKGITSSMTVSATSPNKIIASDSRNEYSSLNLGASSATFVYMATNKWVFFNNN